MTARFSLLPHLPGCKCLCRHRWQRAAFTLVELLVVTVVMGILLALLLPVLFGSKQAARRVYCAGNLRQLALAAQMYLDDHDSRMFPYLSHVTNGGTVFWFGWLQDGSEGERRFDISQGVLYPYLGGQGVEICPSLRYAAARFKFKAQGAAFGYGYNRHLSATNVASVDCSRLALFADAAQINDFQAPASSEHPMLEEFYYVDAGTDGSGYPNAHFRHQKKANVAFCDGHVSLEKPLPGSIDQRLPAECVGRLRPEILKLR